MERDGLGGRKDRDMEREGLGRRKDPDTEQFSLEKKRESLSKKGDCIKPEPLGKIVGPFGEISVIKPQNPACAQDVNDLYAILREAYQTAVNKEETC